jgi:hypothetical protein
MKNTFSQWFKKSGWKSYTLPYAMFFALTYALWRSIPDLAIAPKGWLAVGSIAYFGFGIGITYHMVDAYKISEK